MYRTSTTSEQQPNLPCGDLLHGSGEDYFNICVPLFQASLNGDWPTAKLILDKRPELVRFAITRDNETTLHIAVLAEHTGRTEDFVKNLVDLMSAEDLTLQNKYFNTALSFAATAGNAKMTQIMVEKNTNLLSISDSLGTLPLHKGALYGRHDTVKYLYDASRKLNDDCWTPQRRVSLLLRCVESDLFDVALQIMTDRPELAKDIVSTVLGVLAPKSDAFNEVDPNLMRRIINSISRIIHMKVGRAHKDSDALKLLRFILRNIMRTKSIDEVDGILREPVKSVAGNPKYSSGMLFLATEMGNTRFVVEILRAYPELIWVQNDENQTIFHIAVKYRHQNIYNLLYETGLLKDIIVSLTDKDDNNILHVVGMTSKEMRTRMFGVSLLMQRELLWFKEIENMMPSIWRETKNKDGQTPYEVFFENNEDLVSQGLKWMKDCMVVATLIVTVAFAVAFTVPGGYNQEHGSPIFIHKHTFLVFVIADAISLFFSSTSLLVFLSILTSRHGQRDFLYSLPKKLMIGLVTLFISVVAMMVTFGASFFVLYHNRLKWVPILIATSAVMPVVIFGELQYPLLVDMFRSMYDSRYLFKPRKHMLFNTNQRF